MKNSEKYPEIWSTYQELLKEEAALEKATEKLKKEREDLLSKMAPLQARVRELTEEINSIERPRIIEVRNQKSALAKAMGGKVMSQPVAATEARQ